MEHQENRIHIPFVKHSQIVDLLLIRKQIPDGMEVHCLFADLHHDKKLRHKAFGKQKAGVAVRVNARELPHKGFHIWIFRLFRPS